MSVNYYQKNGELQIPFSYGQGVEVVTPKYDQQYEDIELDTRLDEAETDVERDKYLNSLKNIPNERVLIL